MTENEIGQIIVDLALAVERKNDNEKRCSGETDR